MFNIEHWTEFYDRFMEEGGIIMGTRTKAELPVVKYL